MVDEIGRRADTIAATAQAGESKRAPVQTPAAEQNPDLDAADQLAPSQVSQPLPAAVPAPTGTQTTGAAPPGAAAESGLAPIPISWSPAAACSPRISNHLNLTMGTI